MVSVHIQCTGTMEQWKKIKCMKRGRCTFPEPTQLYTSPVPIKAVKYNDLVRLCEKHLRPEYRDFYINLPKENGNDSLP